jgi:Tol biopolymer transport system component
MAATVAVLAMAGSLAAWMATRRTPAPSGNPLDGARFTRFTDWDGTEAAAEISRDGRFVAFLSDRDGDRDGHFDLFWSQVGTGRFTKLSAELPLINPPSRIFRSLGFSADGSEIWVIAGGGNRKLILPITGGAARPFLGLRATSAAWSPDGSRLVYFVNGDGDPVFMADGQGGDAHEILPAAAGGHNHNPIWSRDGQWIYFTRGIVHGLDQNDEMDIWRMRPNGESLEQLTHRRTWVNYLAMLDDHTLLYISPDDERAGRSLWSLDLASRTSTRLTFGVQQYTSVAVSEDGRRIVVSAANPASGLWRVPIFHDRPAEESDVTPAGTPTAQAIEPRIGGTSTFYISSGGTADGLWRMGPDGTSTVWRDSDGEMAEPPAVSADGARVVLVITQRGTRHLTMLAGDGTGARTLGPGIEPQGAAAWSPDGQWVIVGGQDRQGPALFKIKADTGEVQRFLNQPAFNPAWSRNGLIVFTGNIAGGSVPLVAVRSTGEPVAIPSVKVRPGSYRFLPDGSALVLLDHAATLNWTIVDVKSWTARPLTNLKNRGVVRGFDITPDERYLLFDRSRENSDIVLIDRASR